MDTVSVVIPVYNRADQIAQCLESVFSQTYPTIEVIVVDDGSTDDLEMVLAPVMARIVFIRQENQGQGAARNVGAEAASGRYLAFLDSDDWWNPEKLRLQIASIKGSGCVWGHMRTVVVHNPQDAHEDERRYFGDWYQGPRSGLVAQQLLQTNFICTSSVLLEKKVFDECGGFCVERSLQHFEDYELWLRLAAKHPIDYCEIPDVIYVQHNEFGLSSKEEVTEQIQKNDLVLQRVSKDYVAIYPSEAIRRRRYFYREHLLRAALLQGEQKTARVILREMWRLGGFAGRNLLNASLFLMPAPILTRLSSFIARQSKQQESD